jgi:hypothetical protein
MIFAAAMLWTIFVGGEATVNQYEVNQTCLFSAARVAEVMAQVKEPPPWMPVMCWPSPKQDLEPKINPGNPGKPSNPIGDWDELLARRLLPIQRLHSVTLVPPTP